MRHPDLLMVGYAMQNLRIAIHQIENSQAEFAFVALADISAKQLRNQVMAVADSKNGGATRQYRSFNYRARIVINAMRPARDDHASEGPQFIDRYVARKYFRRNSEFPYLASNQVAVLTAGVKYSDLR